MYRVSPCWKRKSASPVRCNVLMLSLHLRSEIYTRVEIWRQHAIRNQSAQVIRRWQTGSGTGLRSSWAECGSRLGFRNGKTDYGDRSCWDIVHHRLAVVSHVVAVILSSPGFLEQLAPEDGADTVSRTAGNSLPSNAPGLCPKSEDRNCTASGNETNMLNWKRRIRSTSYALTCSVR